MTKETYFSSIASSQKIDRESGVISGVSVITKGVAEGHGLEIDDAMLDQVLHHAKRFSSGVKVRFNHPQSGEDADVESIAGILKQFRREGDNVRADLHLLKTDACFAKIMEMAEVMPASFGLSIAFSGVHKKIGDKIFARCNELYSVDLVSDPAANPSGLFSKEKPEPIKTFNMNIDQKQLAKSLGLDPEKATEQEVSDAMISRLSAKPVDITEFTAKQAALQSKLDEAVTQLAALQKGSANAEAFAKKSEIDNLMAEASRDGRIVPLDNEDLYVSKDGAIEIKMEPVMLKKIIEKLPKGQVQLQKKEPKIPANKDGARLTGEALIEFNKAQKAEGANRLNQHFARLSELN